MKRLASLFRSRKTLVAFATFASDLALHYGLKVDMEIIAAATALGVSIILGISVEDAGQKSANGKNELG